MNKTLNNVTNNTEQKKTTKKNNTSIPRKTGHKNKHTTDIPVSLTTIFDPFVNLSNNLIRLASKSEISINNAINDTFKRHYAISHDQQ